MKVKVHYLFSKNEKIGSRFISWGTKHIYNLSKTPSHIAILVNERWVFESTLFSGVRIISYSEWLKINEEVEKVCHVEKDYAEIKKIFKTIQGKKYDWMGILYLGFYLGLNKFFKYQLPSVNRWESPDKYFCCEGVAKLTGVDNYGMKSPVDLMIELSEVAQQRTQKRP